MSIAELFVRGMAGIHASICSLTDSLVAIEQLLPDVVTFLAAGLRSGWSSPLWRLGIPWESEHIHVIEILMNAHNSMK